MKVNKVLLNITAFFCFIFGAFYTFTLVFIPVAIYLFSAGKLFAYKADHLMDNFAADKKLMMGYTIFISIACFPLGLISIIAYLRLYGNNVKVENASFVKVEDVKTEDETIETVGEAVSEPEANPQQIQEETEEEKMEKLEKLRKFKEKNIISEEEYEMAKEQILGGDKKD